MRDEYAESLLEYGLVHCASHSLRMQARMRGLDRHRDSERSGGESMGVDDRTDSGREKGPLIRERRRGSDH